MTEELQHLINKIQKDAVAKAEEEASEILSAAKQQAARTVKEAEKQAEELLDQAEKHAEVFTTRSIITLEQAARDLLITVGQGVENILSDLVAESVDEAMSTDVIKEMLIKMADNYAAQESVGKIEYLISPEDHETLIKFFSEQYLNKMTEGVELHADNEIIKGFKVSFVDKCVYHDFSNAAIAEALTNFLRPELSKIVHRVAQDNGISEVEPETQQE